MAKQVEFKLQPNPTFTAPVSIQVPGEPNVDLTVTFKHRGRKALAAFFDELAKSNRSDSDALLDIVVDWKGVDAPFNADNLDTLLDNYPTAALSFFESYRRELLEARRKN